MDKAEARRYWHKLEIDKKEKQIIVKRAGAEQKRLAKLEKKAAEPNKKALKYKSKKK